MRIRHFLSKYYWKTLKLVWYNQFFNALFFRKGYRKMINGIPIKVPFMYSWYYPPVYETEKTEFIVQNCKQGDTVIDIGAHIGIFSFFLARQVGPNGKVLSFEPAPNTFKFLQKTIQYNSLNKIVVLEQKAISDESGTETFYIYTNSKISSGNSISDHNTKYISDHHNTTGTPVPTKVTCISLDDLAAQQPMSNLSFIKIDAEGAELDILKGGQKLISQFKPKITLEVHPASFDDPVQTMKTLYDTIKSLGYTVYQNNQIMPETEFLSQLTYFEVILLPTNNLN